MADSLSVIVEIIDVGGIGAIKAEDDPPVAADLDRPEPA